MPEDPLAPLLDLPGVAEAAEAARAAVDALAWDRRLRDAGPALAAESALRGARASAAVDGADVPAALLRPGAAPDGSPMAMAALAAVRVYEALPGLVEVHRRTPPQAWAQLHLLAATGSAGADALGRPRTGPDADDPLRLGPPPPAADVVPRLTALARVLTGPTAVPAVVLAGVVHGELLALRPFAHGSGLVARAASRLALAGRGVDPDLLGVPEEGLLAAGRPAYVAAARGFASGTPDGVARWLLLHCAAVGTGARVAAGLLDGAG